MRKGSGKINTKITKEELINSTKIYDSFRKIYLAYNTKVHIMRNTFKYYDIEIPSNHKIVNDNFFSEINEKSMYWAGFLAADGTIINNSHGCGIRLELSKNDKNHIIKFKNDINHSGNIWDYEKIINKCKDKKWYSIISINSKQIFKDLKNFNITERKTYTYTIPEWILNHSFLNHFIRGYFDGDGCFFHKKRNNKICSVGLSVNGKCIAVTQIYKSIIEKAGLPSRSGSIGIYTNKNDNTITKFTFDSLFDIDKIVKFLYNNSNTFLERKFEKTKIIPKLMSISRLKEFDPILLQSQYDNLKSIRKLAKLYNCSTTMIRNAINKLHLTVKRMPQMARKIT